MDPCSAARREATSKIVVPDAENVGFADFIAYVVLSIVCGEGMRVVLTCGEGVAKNICDPCCAGFVTVITQAPLLTFPRNLLPGV